MTQDIKAIIEETSALNMKLYSPQPVMMDRGEGCYAYDTQGGKYVDFAAGIAVASLGHAYPKLVQTISDQAGKIMACQGSYVTDVKHKASKLLVENGCFDEVYFSNSGAESVEMALKMARKWAYDNKGEGCNEIITFHNSFHGRTYGAASVTAKRLTQPFFDPYLPGVHFADFNDLASVEALVSERTAAIIVEPVQGEGGLTPADPAFLQGLRTLCDKHKIALIFDEIQCGAGRMGTLYAYQSFLGDNGQPIEPDIITLAKGIGSGFPVGAVLAKKDFAKVMMPGTHGTTYGGNPLACAVVACVIEEILADGFLDNVQKTGALLRAQLDALKESSNKIVRVTGKGLMLGFQPAVPVKEVIPALRAQGLMTTQAGSDLVRLTPPLIVGEAHVKEAVAIIEKTLKQDF